MQQALKAQRSALVPSLYGLLEVWLGFQALCGASDADAGDGSGQWFGARNPGGLETQSKLGQLATQVAHQTLPV